MTRVASPGAPGCTMGGCDWLAAAPQEAAARVRNTTVSWHIDRVKPTQDTHRTPIPSYCPRATHFYCARRSSRVGLPLRAVDRRSTVHVAILSLRHVCRECPGMPGIWHHRRCRTPAFRARPVGARVPSDRHPRRVHDVLDVHA